MFADYHVHTEFSDDSWYPMEQVILDAIAMGMEEICLTDHVDYGVKRDWDDPRGFLYRPGDVGEPADRIPASNVDYSKYAREVSRLQQKYAGKIRIRLGLEFGMQMHTIPLYESLFAQYPFDFILLSVHQVDDKDFWNQAFQTGKTQDEYQKRYYEEILGLVESYHNYNVLAHLDMLQRYDRAGFYPFQKVRPIVTEILKTAIADGKGIELNTSYHRYKLPDLTPSREILKLYRELGGRILTVGSDSHRPCHLGAYIRENCRELKDLGFTEICTFEKMEPIFHKL